MEARAVASGMRAGQPYHGSEQHSRGTQCPECDLDRDVIDHKLCPHPFCIAITMRPAASAADLNFLHRLPQTRRGTSNRKGALVARLLVRLALRHVSQMQRQSVFMIPCPWIRT